jgi:hypothetical protein
MASSSRWLRISYSSGRDQRFLRERRTSAFLVLCSDGYDESFPTSAYISAHFTDLEIDVCGGLISEEETIIPINNWRPSHMNYTEAAQTFISSAKTNLDTYANYAVYLVARTVNVLFGCASKMSHPCTSCQSVANDDGDSYVHRWADSFDRVEEWYEHRPAQMKTIFSVSACGLEGLDRAFPIALYGNGAASESAHSYSLVL